MTKAIREETVSHIQIITVGELISELCRWPDRAAVNFRCAMLEQQFRFYRLEERSKDVIEIEISPYPESPPVAPSADASSPDRRTHLARLLHAFDRVKETL